jgi:hypothetical protein
MTGLDAAATEGPESATAATVSATTGADMSAAAAVLTTAADDDTRSATLLDADEDARVEIDADSGEGPAEDGEEDDSDTPECLALNPVAV